MSKLYTDAHRRLQDEFDTRRMADRIEEVGAADTVDDEQKAFIESRDMFFLATVDANGAPTVSYKGGDPGFVRVANENTLMFPSFDGNGMFLSMGNIESSARVGMLFIDFETPHRLRVQGSASLSRDPDLRASFVEADFVVRVTVESIFQNCPRYIHRYQKVDPSRYVPREACETPLAGWKRIDIIQDVLPERDAQQVAAAGGAIPIEEWAEKVKSGDPDA
ncbi:MAG: pyridoxamine 5'-phosphate oxidase family protein [Gammaproteobacteria bacterium]|nr:pyridoxamine 5'-phosphate oxidase family protein [Gammaproteobacteria bacterium]NNM00349.1 pyridoxamine 5'-phosphate oxidase family protein [Gammaproteobacteria bacterium]